MGVPGSTLETYRAALHLRRELGLGTGSLAWVEGLPDHVVALVNRDVLVLTNVGGVPVPLPDGAEVLVASADLDAGHHGPLLPADATVWARLA